MNFTNPTLISYGKKPDTLNINIINPAYFVSNKSSLILNNKSRGINTIKIPS